MSSLHPFVIFFVAALLLPLLRGYGRYALLLAVPIVSAYGLIGLETGSYWQVSLFGYELEPYRVDKLSLLFAYLFHIAALICVVYSLHVRDTMQQAPLCPTRSKNTDITHRSARPFGNPAGPLFQRTGPKASASRPPRAAWPLG